MCKKTKILQFTIAATKGGRTRYVLNIWNYIDKSKFIFDFITFSEELDFKEKIIRQGGRVYYISVHPEQDKERFVCEFNKVLNNGYDAIEIHTSYWVSTIVEKLARLAGIPKIIVHAHSTGIGINQAFDQSMREYYKSLHNRIRNGIDENLATDYWACSYEAAEWLFSDRIPRNRIKVIHNTIDTEKFSYNKNVRGEIREKLGVLKKTVIGFTGRLEKVKNVEFLIDVFNEILRHCKDVCLLIVGDGTLKDELVRKCSHCGMEQGKDYIMTGLVDNVPDYLQAMDIFALPSYFEGFPLSCLEAQCTGLKCVVSDNLPESVAVTELVKRLKLDLSLWVTEVETLMNGYKRTDRSAELKSKGFDTGVYIKELEEEYAK